MDLAYWTLIGKKIVETIISVKVLTIAALMVVSSTMLWHGKMTGGEWAAANAGVISTVFALREGFKIVRLKKGSKGGNDKKDIV